MTGECGDGVVDRDEVCDDGNQRNADGCNVDCRPSGTLEWTVVNVGDGPDSAQAVDVLASGAIVVVGCVDRNAIRESLREGIVERDVLHPQRHVA